MAQLTRQQQVLRAIWTKAVEEGGFELPPLLPNEAIRIRFILNTERKKMTTEAASNPDADTFMVDRMALLKVGQTSLPDGMVKVTIGENIDRVLGKIADALGMTEEALLAADPGVDGARESQARLAAMLAAEALPPASFQEFAPNPFYTRKG